MLGRVPTYYLKQMAQETVLALCGQKRVINQVEVAT